MMKQKTIIGRQVTWFLLVPNYKLWCLYLLTGDTIKAVRKAKDIQKQKMKIENSLTFKIKSEIGYFLSSVP